MLDDSLLVFTECLLETILEGFAMVCFLGTWEGRVDWKQIANVHIFPKNNFLKYNFIKYIICLLYYFVIFAGGMH